MSFYLRILKFFANLFSDRQKNRVNEHFFLKMRCESICLKWKPNMLKLWLTFFQSRGSITR